MHYRQVGGIAARNVSDKSAAAARHATQSGVPSASVNTAGTLPLYDGSPHARDVSDLATAGDWKSALALAQTEASAVPPDVRGYALANVAVCAFQARDMTTLARAIADIEALGDRAPEYVRQIATRLATAISGEMWLDADPCAP